MIAGRRCTFCATVSNVCAMPLESPDTAESHDPAQRRGHKVQYITRIARNASREGLSVTNRGEPHLIDSDAVQLFPIVVAVIRD